MKNLQNIGAFLFTVLVVSGCKREIPVFFVKGTVYESCSKDPVAEYDFILRQWGGFWGQSDIVGSAVTDTKGQFRISYPEDRKQDGNQKILHGEAGLEVNGITGKNIEIEIILNAETKTRIFISTDQPYTSNDTLFYILKNQQFSYSYIVGPFTSGLIDSLATTKTIVKVSQNTLRDNINPPQNDMLVWGLGFNDYYYAYYGYSQIGSHHISVDPACGVTNDVTINLQQ
jgi:hypothetical protein